MLNRTIELLNSREDFLILTHASPDGDTLGAGTALLRALRVLGKRAYLACSDPIPARYEYLFENIPDIFEAFDAKTIIAVDLADTKLLGEKLSVYSDKIALCIDHHASNTGFAELTLLDTSAGAACEVIADVIEGLNVPVDKIIANGIYTGISTDTGCFRYSNTTARTLRTAALMIDRGADSYEINRRMFETKSRVRLEIERQVLQHIDFRFDSRCAVISVTKEMYDLIGSDESEIEGITSLPRQIEGVLVGVTIRQKNGFCKVSVRTHAPLDAAKICGELGGGGHARAAGCEIKGDLKKAKRTVLKVIEGALK